MRSLGVRTIAILLVCASAAVVATPPVRAKQHKSTWGQILIVGGGYTGAGDLYDPASNRFVPEHSTPRMKMRGDTTATLLVTGANAGKVLLAGGYNSKGISRTSTELYDPATNTLVRGPAMNTARTGHTATTIPSAPNRGTILIAGGYDTKNIPQTSTELYDPATNTLVRGPAMRSARFGHTATVIPSGPNAGKILLAGGIGADHVKLSSTEVYDPASNTISPGPAMEFACSRCTATVFASEKNPGKILFAGGYDPRGKLSLTELYDPATNKFLPGPAMEAIRDRHTATAITSGPNGGKILIAGGGSDDSAALASTEVYDPGANTFAPGPAMNTARAEHTATVILSGKNAGKILIAGGVSKNGIGGEDLSSTEIYDPATNKFAAPGDTPKTNWTLLDTVAVQLPPRPPRAAAGSYGRCNSVVEYLNGAEMQCECETSNQGRVIKKALTDMLDDSVETLRKRRYADDVAEPHKMTILDLLHGHFVSDPMYFLDNDAFYRDVKAPVAQKVIRAWLDSMSPNGPELHGSVRIPLSPPDGTYNCCNCVVRYLNGATAKFDTYEQRIVMREAITDMFNHPAAALPKLRYPDSQSNPGRWTIADVLRHYFVPEPGTPPLTDECVFSEGGDERARFMLFAWNDWLLHPAARPPKFPPAEIGCGCNPGTADANGHCNCVATYLNGAHLSVYERDRQAEVKRALTDMLNDPLGVLRKRRYSDDGSKPRTWTVLELLSRQFDPGDGATNLSYGDCFFKDVKKPTAQKAIRTWIGWLNHPTGLQPSEQSR